MGISILFIIFIAVLVSATMIVPIIMLILNKHKYSRVHRTTWIALGLLIGHWIFYLALGYTWLPITIADLVFVPVWFLVSIVGVTASWFEFKNNKLIAIPVAGLSLLSLLFCWFITGITAM